MDVTLRELPMSLKSSRAMVEGFLARFSLRLEPLDYYAAYFDGEQMVCGGGYAGNTIKCVAVDETRRGEGFSNKLLSHLLARLRHEGAENIFLFTKPENEAMFMDLGFHPVGKTDEALLFETKADGIASFAKALKPWRKEGLSGCVVMNANPFTMGHLYLLEEALRHCDTLHVFVVQEEGSVFPFAVRRRLIEQGTAHLHNLHIHDGGPYIISSATFPTYFLKEDSDTASVHAKLDVDIFGRHIAPALGISLRFVGEEPNDPMTARYNAAMQELLPSYGVTPVVFSRKEEDGCAISASAVRKAAAAGDWEKVKRLVPDFTLRFLKSHEAQPILERIRATR